MSIDTNTKALLYNTEDPNMKKMINLPFEEDELEETLRLIGVIQTKEYTFDQMANGDLDKEFEGEELDAEDLFKKGKWRVESIESDYLAAEGAKYADDPFYANELVKEIEFIDEDKSDLFDALLEDGCSLEEAIRETEDGSADFFSGVTLEELAQQFNDEGLFSEEFLLEHIDWEGIARDLSFDGYTEVSGGVLRRD